MRFLLIVEYMYDLYYRWKHSQVNSHPNVLIVAYRNISELMALYKTVLNFFDTVVKLNCQHDSVDQIFKTYVKM